MHPGDPCEFYTITNLFADHWCDTSHNWTLAWLNSLLKSLVLTAATWKAAANPFHIPWAIHQRCPLFRSEFDLGLTKITGQYITKVSPLWIVQNPFWHITGHLGEFLEPLTSPVNTYMITFHIGNVLMQQKWLSRTVWRCNIQLLDRSTFRNWKSISIVCLYCNQGRNVFETELCTTSKNNLEL